MPPTPGDDILAGTSGADTIDALAGNDSVDGLGGDDSLLGNDDNDTLIGGFGLDMLDGGNGDDSLSGGADSDTYAGGAGYDIFHISALDTGVTDFITDFAAEDFIELGNTSGTQKDPGADLLTFIGTAAFSGAAGEVRYATGGGATFIHVDVDGNGVADQTVQINNGMFGLRTTVPNGPTLISTSAFGTLTAGDDSYYGGMGADDLIDGGMGSDNLAGMEGDDSVLGGDGDDFIQEHVGNDTIDGGAGTDSVTRFYGEAADVTITDSSIINWLTGETDSISNIEQVFISNRLAPASHDTLDGSLATILLNLHGGAGNDIVIGGSNADNIEGDVGADTLTGALGADIFDFDYLQEVGGDRIEDLEPLDRVDFATIQGLFFDGDPDGADLTFIGTAAFSGTAGEIRYVNAFYSTQIEIDTDGNAVADRTVLITNGGFDLVETAADSARLMIVPGSITTGADDYVGSNAADMIDMLDGDDTVQALDGDDTVSGNLGADRILGGDGKDSVNGGDGYDVLEGGAGNDTLRGEAGLDTLFGEGGTDLLVGSLDNDILYGGAGFDVLHGNEANDSLFGQEDDDFLFGGDGADTLSGGGAVDYLVGGPGDDSLDGGTENDEIEGDAGLDTLFGGDGDDSLAGSFDNDVLYGGAGIDSLYGDDANDSLFGDDNDDSLSGGGGADTVFGGAGSDELQGGASADYLDGGTDDDTALYFAAGAAVVIDLTAGTGAGDEAAGDTLVGIENVWGSLFNDTIIGAGTDNLLYGGFAGDDELQGGAGADTLDGGAGLDTLDGGIGADTLKGGSGADSLDGGADSDTVDLSDATTKVTVRLWNQTVTGDIATGDVISGIESARGGSAGDAIVGSDAVANRLVGNAGDDAVHGLSGNDTLEGNDGNDTLKGGAGADVMSGGANFDTVDYSDSASGVKVRLWNQTVTDGLATGDAIAGIENAIGGSSTDALVGSNGVANTLSGNGGNDNLHGLSGNDILIGGSGKDTLTGGTGADRFEFAGAFGIDRIADFEGGAGAGDFIRLIGLGAAFDTFAEVMAVTTQSGANTIINFGGGATITLLSFTAATLNADDFLFG